MRNYLPMFFLFLSLTTSYSQVKFEKGYFINNLGQKTECLIKNKEWKSNPNVIEYKSTAEDKVTELKIEEIQEFCIYESSKYIRKKINIDRSVGLDADLSGKRNITLKKETIFLKYLIEGSANLYGYSDANFYTYFFDVNNSETEQLIYKKTINDKNSIVEYEQFKQQLLNTMKCDQIKIEEIEKLSYNKDKLVSIFNKYNGCTDNTLTNNYNSKKRSDVLNLYIRPGIVFQNSDISNSLFTNSGAQFGKNTTFRIGCELEVILPFNNSKWAIIVEPNYSSYNVESTHKSTPLYLDYKAFNVPVGFRHYFFLSDSSKLFVNLSYSLNFSMNSKMFYGYFNQDFDLDPADNLDAGIGYSYKNKYSVEFRFGTEKDLLSDYVNWEAHYQSSSIILGYKLF